MGYIDDLSVDSYAELFYHPTQFNSFHTPSNTMRVLPPLPDEEMYRHPLSTKNGQHWLSNKANLLLQNKVTDQKGIYKSVSALPNKIFTNNNSQYSRMTTGFNNNNNNIFYILVFIALIYGLISMCQ